MIMAKKSFKVGKLIRDHVPQLLQAKGIVLNTNVMEHEEYISKIKDKLLEEAHEVFEVHNTNELCEELGDVLEVIHALSKATGISMQQIEQKRIEKMKIKGGFENKLFNHSIEIDESNQKINF